MQSRFVFYHHFLGLLHNSIVYREESVSTTYIVACIKFHWAQLRSIAVGDDIPPSPAKCGTEGFRPSSSSDL
ncbi:hypothetical protein VN97_g955 [Penicillium thymicola]|uniref:Uncharacterized protein n=1 Tax=Penicillium thymicola TaxID=293382 RepID=A0AAI9TRS7_PENTH|nr:hypothetical protein VN97_g955 [Penicillium thymicola]